MIFIKKEFISELKHNLLFNFLSGNKIFFTSYSFLNNYKSKYTIIENSFSYLQKKIKLLFNLSC